MKRKQIIHHKVQLEYFIQLLRMVIWCSIVFAAVLFILSALFFYKKMLLSAVLAATLAFVSFRVLRKYSVIITKNWLRSRGGYEEMLLFLDEEMNGANSREFFDLLERAFKVVDS